MNYLIVALLAIWPGLSSAQFSSPAPNVAAITPTSSGQIGIKPVETYPPESYHALHAHTQYWDQESSTTKWIGVNTEMLTELPYITTVDNKPTTTSIVPVHIIASTVTTSEEGMATGDVAIVLSSKLIEDLKGIAEKVPGCSGGRKRGVCSYNPDWVADFIERIQNELQPGGILEYMTNVPLPGFTFSASDVASFIQGIANRRVATIAGLGIIAWKVDWGGVFKLAKETITSSGGESSSDDNPKCQLPAPKCKDCEGIEGICTSLNPGCPCEREQCPSEMPDCTDENCKGDENNQCTEQNKGCECTRKCEEDPESIPFCDGCGGNAGENKCNGIKEENDKWKDCECYEFGEIVKPQFLPDQEELDQARMHVDDYQYPDPSDDDPDKAVTIVLMHYWGLSVATNTNQNFNSWKFFQHKPGQAGDGCTGDVVLNDQATRWSDSNAASNPPWPHGTFTMTLFGVEGCVYLNDGGGTGILRCPGMPEGKFVNCKEEREKSDTSAVKACSYWLNMNSERHRVAYCEWK